MSRNYIPVLKEQGFPLDVANMINEQATWEYKDYEILADQIVNKLLDNYHYPKKYINVDMLREDIVNILISNLGLTFEDFVNLTKDLPSILNYIQKIETMIQLIPHQPYIFDRLTSIMQLLLNFLNEKGRKSGYFDFFRRTF